MNYDEMKSELLKASNAYYNKSISIMSDVEFDRLKDEFTRLYPTDSILLTIGSPIIENTKWKKENHKIPMASLNKVNIQTEFEDWVNKKGIKEFIIEEKLDGISIDLEYENSILVKSITRGDGILGENIFKNVIQMKNVKTNIPKFTGSIRGEIVLCKDDFEKLNKEQEKNSDDLFSNPRNAASGISKKFKGDNCKHLTIFYYDVTGNWNNEEDKMNWFKLQNLKTCFWKKCNKDDCIEIYNNYENELREKVNYDIDGLVVKCNSIDRLKELGNSSEGNPIAQIAWKFTSIKKETTLLDVVWQLGNSLRLTPVAILNPVDICGVTVQRATLHNLDNFIKLNLYKGAKCIISRRNDVIPFVESVDFPDKNSNPEYFKAPTICPSCNKNVKSDGVYLICDNEECSGGKIGNIKKWIKTLDLKGIGGEIIESLFNAGLIKEPSDFYNLKQENIECLEGFGKRSAEKIINVINNKTEIPLREFIGGINIPNFGRRMTDTLIESGYDTLEKILNMNQKELINIKGIEVTTANTLIDGLMKRKEIMNNLIEVGVTIQKPKEKKIMAKGKENVFTGKKVVFTGALEIKRTDAQSMVMEVGGECPSSLSKTTDYLVIADINSTSSKAQKARKFGTQLIGEEEFTKMIRG